MDNTDTKDLDSNDIKLNGEEQSPADEMVAAVGKVEHKVAGAMNDDLMDTAGHDKVIEHGSVEDVAEAIVDHVKDKEESQ